jgi:hypothetical protein
MKINEVKKIREQCGFTHLVIFGADENGDLHVATHGESKENAKEAADAGNNLKTHLGFPKIKCNSEPFERVCRTCDFVHDSTGCSGSHFYSCCFEPKSISVSGDRTACGHYVCKY